MKRFFAPAIVVALLAAAPLSAATVQVAQQSTKGPFFDASGHNVWGEVASLSMNGTARNNVGAGVFRLKATDQSGSVQKFLAFCLEPLEWLTLPKTHTVGTSLKFSVVNKLGALMDGYFGKITNSSTAAAFQMAVWEIANEKSGTYDISAGDFQITQGNAATVQLAQSWLSQVALTSGGKYPVTIFSAAGTQDLLTDIPASVPLPATALGLFGALGGLGGLRALRRRKHA